MKKYTAVVLGLLFSISFASTVMAAEPSSIYADQIDYDFRNGQAVAKGNVVIKRDGGTATSKNADYNTKTGNGKLTGDVVSNKEDAKVTCQTMNIAEQGDHITAIGNAVLKKADKTLRASQVEYYAKREYAETVGDWAQLGMDDGSTIDAAYLNYSMKEGLATGDGNVRIVSPPRKLTARGDRAIYNTKAEDGTIELIGHATATQDGDTVSGNTLTLKGTGAQKDQVAIADGNVKLVFVPKPEKKQPPVEPYYSIVGDSPVPEEIYKQSNWPGETIKIGETALA